MFLCYSETNPLTRSATPVQPSDTISLDLCQHHSAGEDHLLAQGYQVAQFLPCPVHILLMDSGRFGGQSCLYVPSPARRNNSTILTNVASHTQWKLNCFLHKQLCDDQLPNQDPFMGHSEDEMEQGRPLEDIRAWESDSWFCDGTLKQCDHLPCVLFQTNGIKCIS